MNKLTKLFIASALVMGFQVPAFAQASLEEVIVTAQRTEQSLQDVPIAVTALSGADLDTKQVITFSDLQLNVPGLNFGQTNFSGSSINIRGIGNLSTGDSFDGSVSYHINDGTITTTGIGVENYDVERIEILRGPQGTLFGRGTTAGSVNVINNKAELGEDYGKIKVTAGNYKTQKLEYMANLSITDQLSARFAGYALKRDGYIDNLYLPDTNYDGRDQNSARLSLAWENDQTRVDFNYEVYNEDSTRALKGDYICENSPTPDRGCVFGGQKREQANPAGTYDGIIAAALLNIAPAGANIDAYIASGLLSTADNSVRPANMKRGQTHVDFAPVWEVDSDLTQLLISHDLDAGTLSFNATLQDSNYYNRADTDMAVGPRIGCKNNAGAVVVNDGTGVCASAAQNASGGTFNLMNIAVGGYRGVRGPTIAEEIAGNITVLEQDKYLLVKDYNRTAFIDGNTGERQTRYYELKFNSDFDGPHNFLFGVNTFEIESISRFLTASSPLSMLAPAASYYPATFGTANAYDLDAFGVFGEYYYQINDDMKLTVGARWADEEKNIDTFRSTYNMGTDYNSGAVGAAVAALGRQAFANQGWPQNGDALLVHASMTSCVPSADGLAGYTAGGNFCNESANEVLQAMKDINGTDITATLNAEAAAYATAAVAKVAADTALAADPNNATKQATAAAALIAATSATLQSVITIATNVDAMYVADLDYRKNGWPALNTDKFDYETVSGRVVFDWQYDDNSMFYASYARGVKPAGVNPAYNPRIYRPCSAGSSGGKAWVAGDAATCIDIPSQTEEEESDTFEVGVKTDLMDGQLRLNASAYFTDYTNLQLASVIAATTYNFNSDAEIMGAELELAYLPEWDNNLRFDLMFSFIDSEITSDDSRLNPFNKLAIGTGAPSDDYHLMRCTALLYDATAACIGTAFLVKKADLNTALAAMGTANQTISPTDWITGLGQIQGQQNAAGAVATVNSYPSYGDRNKFDVAGTAGLYNIDTFVGLNSPIKGNELPQTPETAINLTATYQVNLGNGDLLVPTLTYYYQSDMFSTEYNVVATDTIESWDEFNLGLLYVPAQGDWTIKAYARNVTDEDNVTTKYNSTDITGNFQTWQYREPRTVGIELTMDF